MTNYLLFYTLVFATSTLISFIIMPQAFILSNNVKAIDEPKKDKRKIHTNKVPRLGGVFIFITFIVCYMIYREQIYNNIYNDNVNSFPFFILDSIFVCSFLILLMGIFDDIHPLKAKTKLFIQTLASSLLVFKGGLLVKNIDFFFVNIVFPVGLDKIFTVLWIILLTNAFNLLDGIDGLAGGISVISLLTMTFIGIIQNNPSTTPIIILLLILSGSITGFLPYNLTFPAKIFMGDCGAQFIGFMMGSLSVYGYKQVIFSSFIIPIFILVIPLLDTILSFFRRIFHNVSTAKPDRMHMHHIVLNKVCSTGKTLMIFYFVSILFSITAIVYSLNKLYGLIIFAVVFIFSELLLEYFLLISVYYWPLINIIVKFAPNKIKERHYINIMNTIRKRDY